MASVGNGHGMSTAQPGSQLCSLTLGLERVPTSLGPQFPHRVECGACPHAARHAHLPELPAVDVSEGVPAGPAAAVVTRSRPSTECPSQAKPCWTPQTPPSGLWSLRGIAGKRCPTRPRGVAAVSRGVSPHRLGSQLPSPVTFWTEPGRSCTQPPPGLLAPRLTLEPGLPPRGLEASCPAPMVRRPSESLQAPCSGSGPECAVQSSHAAPSCCPPLLALRGPGCFTPEPLGDAWRALTNSCHSQPPPAAGVTILPLFLR